MAAQDLLHTPIHEAHVKAGARMVAFAGWHLPIQYTGIVDEHVAVREKAGLFDVSHMGEVFVKGPEALEFLQRVTCNNLAKIGVGRAQYTGLMLPNGAFVDDLVAYRVGEQEYLLVVNAANTAKDFAYLRENADGFEVDLENVSSAYCQLAVQGPNAEKILGGICEADLASVRYYGFVQTEVEGVSCLVSRTGYTGEDGFEIYAPSEAGENLWYAVLGAGAPDGIVPVGLGARDTLRLEAALALYGNDIDDTTTALEAGLGWIVKLKKGEFIGREVLRKQRDEGVEARLVGFEMAGRAIARPGYPVLKDGREVGRVTSGTHAPYLRKNIGLAYLPDGMWEVGTRFEVGIRKKSEPAEVVPTPFYKRNR